MIRLALVVTLMATMWWLRWLGPTRRRAVAIRMFRNPHALCKSKNRQPSRIIDFTVAQVQNQHLTADGIFSTTLFVRTEADVTKFKQTYLQPLLQANSQLRKLMPTWYYRVYVPANFDDSLRQQLLVGDMEVFTMRSNNELFEGTMWRFLPLFENGKPFLCCDADSDYSKVWDDLKQWLQTKNKTFFHIVVPVINRFWPISAGMWGCKPNDLPERKKHDLYQKLIENARQCSSFGCDELFLAKELYPNFAEFGVVRHRMLKHIEPLVILTVVILLLNFSVFHLKK